jgi:hypothetical protein
MLQYADSIHLLALELKAVFEKLQQAEQSGLSQEAIKKLEEQAAEQVWLQTIRTQVIFMLIFFYK